MYIINNIVYRNVVHQSAMLEKTSTETKG